MELYRSPVVAMTPAQGEPTMNRQHDHDELIDLGAASTEARGTPFGSDDRKGGLIPVAGLTAV
jgi:hypothetical protein